MPPVLSVGVRYQRAPSNRSLRALATPAVSAPASGWPPTKRSAPSRPAMGGARPAFGRAADEALGALEAGDGGDQLALGRADVGDRGVGTGGADHRCEEGGQGPDR